MSNAIAPELAARPPGGTRRIDVESLARVEGEGALHVRIEGNTLEHVALRIYEPPRLFEGFLRGRHYTEPPDITARICGICPVAYQMAACHALEAACGVTVTGRCRELRRLLYCGEWIESHALHVYMLHAPDFLGYPSGIHLAADHRATVEQGLRLKKLGNDLMDGARRSRDPSGQRRASAASSALPGLEELRALREPLLRAREDALETVRWVAGFEFPDVEPDRVFVALSPPGRVPAQRGTAASRAAASTCRSSAFEDHVVEEHVPHSHRAALATLDARALPGGAAGALRAQPRPPVAAGAGGGARRRASARWCATRSRASWCARSSSCTRARRRCASSTRTSRPTGRASRCRRAPGAATRAPKRRAARSTTATRSTTRASCSTHGSCRPPPRTRRASSRTYATSSRAT